MSVPALDAALAGPGRVIAVVGTAGTTDLGAIDPLDALAERAAAHRAWFHVDAAVGSGLLLSDTLRERLRGIERADSVTADLHKLWWQPFSAGALLVPDVARLRAVHHASVYLNRPEDEAEGTLNLVGRSLDTSRRFDALKVLIALRATGRRRLARDGRHGGGAGRARGARHRGAARARAARAAADGDGRRSARRGGDAENIRVQRALFASGRAMLGRTRVDGAVALKLTLLNPLTTPAEVDALLDLVVST